MIINKLTNELTRQMILYDNNLINALELTTINNFVTRMDLELNIKRSCDLYKLEINNVADRPLIFIGTSTQTFYEVRQALNNNKGNFKYNNKIVSDNTNLKDILQANATNVITLT
jgi:hypothetical protein